MGKLKKGSPFSTPDFRKQRALWYAKLKAEGFQDIEVAKKAESEYEDEDLHKWSSRFKADSNDDRHRFHSKQEYYRQAEHFLNLHRFSDLLDKVLWKGHVEGMGAVEIARPLGIGPGAVRKRINRLVTEFAEWRKKEAAKDDAAEGLHYDDEDQ